MQKSALNICIQKQKQYNHTAKVQSCGQQKTHHCLAKTKPEATKKEISLHIHTQEYTQHLKSGIMKIIMTGEYGIVLSETCPATSRL